MILSTTEGMKVISYTFDPKDIELITDYPDRTAITLRSGKTIALQLTDDTYNELLDEIESRR